MEFKELTLEELIQGYVWLDEEQAYQCIFCGEKFEEGLIYTSRGRSVNAHRAMQEHLFDEHDGVFESLLEMDKQVNGFRTAKRRFWRVCTAKRTTRRSAMPVRSVPRPCERINSTCRR